MLKTVPLGAIVYGVFFPCRLGRSCNSRYLCTQIIHITNKTNLTKTNEKEHFYFIGALGGDGH